MQIRNGAELIKPIPALALTSVVAGAGSDGAKITGQAFSRLGFQSCLLDIGGSATLGDTETVSLEVEIQHCDTLGGTYETAVVLQAETVVLTAVGALTSERFQVPLPVGLAKYKEFVKFNVIPTMSAGSIDTLSVIASAQLTDSEVEPLQLSFVAIV